jgi:hypothetical protein
VRRAAYTHGTPARRPGCASGASAITSPGRVGLGALSGGSTLPPSQAIPIASTMFASSPLPSVAHLACSLLSTQRCQPHLRQSAPPPQTRRLPRQSGQAPRPGVFCTRLLCHGRPAARLLTTVPASVATAPMPAATSSATHTGAPSTPGVIAPNTTPTPRPTHIPGSEKISLASSHWPATQFQALSHQDVSRSGCAGVGAGATPRSCAATLPAAIRPTVPSTAAATAAGLSSPRAAITAAGSAVLGAVSVACDADGWKAAGGVDALVVAGLPEIKRPRVLTPALLAGACARLRQGGPRRSGPSGSRSPGFSAVC